MSETVSQNFEIQETLYHALINKNERAYDYLYKQLLGTFKHWVHTRNGSEMDAEDAFQKGLLNFIINLEEGKYQLQSNTKVTSVVFDYCKKIWLNELDSSRLKTRTALPDFYDQESDENLQKDLERHETIEAVRAAIGQLKSDCQNMVQWFYIDDFSIREIAEKLNMKENSTKQKRFDCTEKLKMIFKNNKIKK